jgi:HEAT repeat protein
VLDARHAALRCALLALLGSALCAFSWPGRSQRLLAELHAAEEPRERADLVRLLGTTGDAGVREALLEAARDREPSVRAEAARALAELARALRAVPSASGEPAASEEERETRGDATRETLAALLSDSAPRVRAAAAEALGQVAARGADEDLDLLLRSLSDEDPKVRAASARAFAALRATRAVAALGRSLSDPSLEVASAAAAALAAEGGSQALSLLASEFGQLPPELRVTILDAVPGAWPTLADKLARLALADENSEVVLAGLRLVLRQRLGAALEQVETLTGAHAARVTEAARGTLRELRAPALAHAARARPAWLEPLLRAGDPGLPAAQAEEALQALEANLSPGEALAADPLAEWLLRAPAALRARIARLLAETRAPVRAGGLRALLDQPDPALQSALCDVLAHTHDPDHVPALAPLLGAQEAALRTAAARALGAIADRSTLEQLRETLARGPARAHAPAAYALALALERLRGELGRRAAQRLQRTLLRALLTDDEASAAHAARALGVLDPYAATQTLRKHAGQLGARRALALLRAGALDGSPGARALRARYLTRPEPALAATALTARLLGNPPPPHELLALTSSGRWPLGPIAAFGLARATPAALRTLDGQLLCRSARNAREPTTARNLRLALARLQVACAGLPRASAEPAGAAEAAAGALQLLVFADGSRLISAADAARDASWPRLRHSSVADPWHDPYRASP